MGNNVDAKFKGAADKPLSDEALADAIFRDKKDVLECYEIIKKNPKLYDAVAELTGEYTVEQAFVDSVNTKEVLLNEGPENWAKLLELLAANRSK